MLIDTPGLPPMTGGSGAASTKQVSNAGSQFGNAWATENSPRLGWHASVLAEAGEDGIGSGVIPSNRYIPSAACTRCGAWRGELGSEPRVEQYIANLVEVFAAVRRVLRADGVLWVNLGSSYAGSGKGPTGHNGIGDQEKRQGFRTSKGARLGSVHGESGHTSGVRPLPGYRAKDLIQTPSLLFEALQRDGWRLRSVAPWIKRNGMPESCTDRPTHSLEWIGLFSKSAAYFYDAEAGRLAPTSQPQRRFAALRYGTGAYRQDGMQGLRDEPAPDAPDAGRNRRNTDWYFGGLDAEIEAVTEELAALRALRDNGGVRLGDDGLPLAFDVNPAGFPGSHFATWPPALVRPMVALSTSERGACATCGAPWRRVVERQTDWQRTAEDHARTRGVNGAAERAKQPFNAERVSTTTGWAPTCPHPDADVVPCTVLDPFAGSSTTLLVARQLGRIGWGIELQPDYVQMSINRLRQGVLL